MTEHSHENVKAHSTVNIVEFAFAPHHMAVTVGATITFATAGACKCDRCLRLLMVGTIKLETSAGSEVPR